MSVEPSIYQIASSSARPRTRASVTRRAGTLLKGVVPLGSALSLVLGLAACSITGPGPAPAPSWIDTPPQADGYVYAVGEFVGALHPEDNPTYAVKKARAELADRLKFRVQSTSEVRVRDDDTRFRSDTRIESTADIKNVELIEMWTDFDGVKGPKGQVFVLVRAPKQ
jgi:hypothetical protein